MDLKQAYESIIQALKRQLDAEMPLAKEADDTLVAKGLLYNPAEAAALFVDPIEGYVDRIAEEVSTESCNGHRYTVALYQRDDEAALCDAIADLAFAQIQRKPVVKKPNRQGSTRTPSPSSWVSTPSSSSSTAASRPTTSLVSTSAPSITII